MAGNSKKKNTGREIINFTFDLKGSLQLPKNVAFGYFFYLKKKSKPSPGDKNEHTNNIMHYFP